MKANEVFTANIELEIPYDIFEPGKVSPTTQQEIINFLKEEGFENIEINFNDNNQVNYLTCLTSVSPFEKFRYPEDAAIGLLTALKSKNLLNETNLKEFADDEIVYVYPACPKTLAIVTYDDLLEAEENSKKTTNQTKKQSSKNTI